MNRIKWTAKRIALGAALSLAVTAAAFFWATYLSEGVSPDRETGVGGGNLAQAISIDLESGLTPTNPVEVTATVDNTAGHPITWQSFVLTPETPLVPECAAWLGFYAEKLDGTEATAWPSITAGTNSQKLTPIPAGKHSIFDYSFAPSPGTKMFLRFDPTQTGVNQEACEATTVRVHGELTMPPA